MENCALEVRNVTMKFPGVIALNDVSMQFQRGEVHALLGENGAGKSTLIKVLSGVYTPTEGEVFRNGKKVPHMTVHKAAELGIAAIHQELNLIPELSIAENIFLGKEAISGLGILKRREMNKRAAELLNRFNIDLDPTTKVKNLPIAKQQVVEIAKALDGDAEVFIFDEPTDVLTDKETVLLFDIIRQLKKQNKVVIYISHRLDELPEICDTFSVLRDGHYVDSGNIGDCSKSDIIRLMIGRDLKNQFPYEPAEPAGIVLELRKCRRNGTEAEVSMQVDAGEVVGLYGLVGSGRTELMRCIVGTEKLAGGELLLMGEAVKLKSVAHAHRLGIYYSTEDRKADGIISGAGVDFNMTLPSIRQICQGNVISFRKEKKLCDEMIQEFSIKTPAAKTEIQTLSGGNQQKALLAKALLTHPKALILDEPTRGIDVGTKADIYQIINKLKAQGVAVIVISSELPEVMGISDRVLVFHNGAITGEFSHTECTEHALTQCAFGLKREVIKS